MTKKIEDYIIAVAAMEMYDIEVRSTEMEPLIIGTNKDYADIKDWCDCKINEWIETAWKVMELPVTNIFEE